MAAYYVLPLSTGQEKDDGDEGLFSLPRKCSQEKAQWLKQAAYITCSSAIQCDEQFIVVQCALEALFHTYSSNM